MNRRKFLATFSSTILVSSLSHKGWRKILEKQTAIIHSTIAQVENGTIYNRIKAAVDALGGITRFVKPNNTVVIKPNAAFAQTPEMGGNTTPEVVGAVIKLCKQASAKSITVVEHCLSAHGRFGTSRDLSGITQIALKEGASVFDAGADPMNYTNIRLNAPAIPSQGFISKLIKADVVINVPRSKEHPIAGYTLCIKNLMGTMQNPKLFHNPLKKIDMDYLYWFKFLRYLGIWENAQNNSYGKNTLLPVNLVALAKIMKSKITLNIVDMTDLVRNWSAERPGILEPKNMIIAGTDMVSVDAYCIKIFGEDPLGNWESASIDNYIRLMHEAKIGNANISNFSIKKIIL